MELSGKCKVEFEKWYMSDKVSKEHPHIVDFYTYPKAMQYGVLVDFFDSVGLELVVHKFKGRYVASIYLEQEYLKSHLDDEEIKCNKKGYTTRPISQTEAVIKANEIRNKQLKT
jgi:hypothetical protein